MPCLVGFVRRLPADPGRNRWELAPFRRFFVEILSDPRTAARGHIDARGLKRLISLQLKGHNFGGLFQTLATIELFYRYFVEGEMPERALLGGARAGHG